MTLSESANWDCSTNWRSFLAGIRRPCHRRPCKRPRIKLAFRSNKKDRSGRSKGTKQTDHSSSDQLSP